MCVRRFKNDGSRFVILHVEDDPVARGILNRNISLKFPTTILMAAENGEIGLEMINMFSPDLVITDISMPIMDGLTMAEQIKAIFPDKPIIILSADDLNYRLKEKSKEMGVDLCLQMPIKFDRLSSALEQFMQSAIHH